MRTAATFKPKVKAKLDEFYRAWVALPETRDFIRRLAESSRNGTLLTAIISQSTIPSGFSQPPLSPPVSRHSRGVVVASPAAPPSPSQAQSRIHAARMPSPQTIQAITIPPPIIEKIKLFAIPSSFFAVEQQQNKIVEEQLDVIRTVFQKIGTGGQNKTSGITLSQFRSDIIKQAFDIPRWFAKPVFKRIYKGEKMIAQNKLNSRKMQRGIRGSGPGYIQEEQEGQKDQGKDKGNVGSQSGGSRIRDEDDEIDEELDRMIKESNDDIKLANNQQSNQQGNANNQTNANDLDDIEDEKLDQLTVTEAQVINLLDTHPGLEFLQRTPEFQDRYMESVVVRMFYYVNTSEDDRMTLNEIEKSDLTETCHLCDDETNINKILRFFSYEHFYVLYCKFWELDNDHDQYISDQDLVRFGSYSLSRRTIDRIMVDEAPRKLKSGSPRKMNFEDFVWFLLSEEDKTSSASINYWFRIIDLDADGVISAWEMEQFYKDQVERLEGIDMEIVKFNDILVQCVDMIRPQRSVDEESRLERENTKRRTFLLGDQSSGYTSLLQYQNNSQTNSQTSLVPNASSPSQLTQNSNESIQSASQNSNSQFGQPQSPSSLNKTPQFPNSQSNAAQLSQYFTQQGFAITLGDMKRSKLAGIVFNILTNLAKYINFETKDPFGVRDQTNPMSDWERYAATEYERLSVEEDDNDDMTNAGGINIGDGDPGQFDDIDGGTGH
ncbi:MAG: putative Serine/threonine protein phosphatase 2A regulatory subunit B''beta [Streblomastix strix]|uniref:Putative Serine/threonine protein phosphatase 2A regulatory subunit B''beta n=1 Tax=Streblomastix strix TaxID=222440 RepID=A0A5J4WI46_9EUKA|nr:MAG: putative Serine/threonine protein phosphatase 2A regulatory subunit B''beta [Streblomastix strix]